MPKVSVIVPTYNAEKYVVDALRSVLDQDYDNLEIIVCDDASSDKTPARILELVDKYPTKLVVRFNEINLGVTKNCNQALSLCTGKYVAFHAGDDVMLPGKIRAQVEHMELNPECSISYHNVDVFLSDSGQTLNHFNSWRRPARNGDVRTSIRYGCFNSGCATMARRSHIPADGYDERFPVASDWHLWIRILLNGGEIQYLNKVLSRYRRHGQNVTEISGGYSKQAILDTLNVTNWIAVNYPEYLTEALASYAISLRALRNVESGKYYRKALLLSLRVRFNLLAFAGLALNIGSLGLMKI